jgi:hypothetical protein
MKVTFVQPPRDGLDASELAPPLGLLTLAAVLRDDDVDVTIVDLNLECFVNPSNAGPLFYEWAAKRVASTAPDLVGFTSMAIESHVGLEIARRLKLRDPGVRIVMGGPHFSAIAQEVLAFYPWVDFVVVGSGETAVRGLVRALRRQGPLSAVSNLAHMNGGEYRLDRSLTLDGSLDDHPFPAYELVDLGAYFAINPYRVLDIEQNRGCVLHCSFCYAANHWGRGEQARSIDRLVEDVQRHYDLGARHLSFVGDNFLNSKARGKAVADAIAGANPGVTWRCWATLPQLSEDVVESFSRADCRYIFVGVDAVSARTKKDLQKSYFRGWPSLRQSLERCLDRNIVPTCAFLLYPDSSDESRADSEEAVAVATHVNLLRCGVRLNPLTIYARTGLAPTTAEYPVEASNEKARVLFYGHWMTERNSYAEERPWLFPYHSTIGPPERFSSFIRAAHVGHTLFNHFSRTLMQAIHAGIPLWPLLQETAAQVGYVDGQKLAWKDQEVGVFLELVRSRRTTPEMRDTLEFEEAEFRLHHTPSRSRVTVEIDGTHLDVWLMPHARVTLSRSPLAYDTTDPPAAPEPGFASKYLVLPSGPGMRYLRPMDGADRLIRALGDAAADGRTVPASATGVASLLAANVIALSAESAWNSMEDLRHE